MTDSFDELLIAHSHDGAVVEVTFNRPARRNAFTAAMYSRLHELCDELAAEPAASTVRALVLRGAGGKAFAAGNEISDFLERDAVDYEEWLAELFTKIRRLPQVTIAVVDGACVGGGLVVASHCDLRIATAHSRFGYPIGKTLGNALSAGIVYRSAAIFGESLVREMLLAARLITADRAYAVGALAHVAEDGAALDAELASILDGITAMSRVTIGHTKSQLDHLVEVREAGPDEEARMREIYTGPDFNEGVRAFLAKERPNFA